MNSTDLQFIANTLASLESLSDLEDPIVRAEYCYLIAAPIVSDDALHAWADLYQVERLARRVPFDVFISSPGYWCLRFGITPRPFDQ